MSSATVTISRLGGLGDGTGVLDGEQLFVAKSTVGDVLEVHITGKSNGIKRAEIVSVITPGHDRITPPCKHFASCGGCALQHLNDEAYRRFKQDSVTMALGYGGYEGTAPRYHFLPANTRRRVEFKVQNNALSLVESKSHERVAITQCLILTPRLQALIQPLNALLPTLPGINSVQLTQADSGVDIQIKASGPLPEAALKAFASSHDLARINHIERRPVTMDFGGQQVTLPAGSFLQASKEAEMLMSSLVLQAAKGKRNIVEFFSGLGTYTFGLAANAKIHAQELDVPMVRAMQAANHPNIRARSRDLFQHPLTVEELEEYDAAVINPPRAGADMQTRNLAKSGIPTIIMVSCNPATWSRDAKTLKHAGYALASLDVIDQFVYSPHVELVSVFRRLHT